MLVISPCQATTSLLEKLPNKTTLIFICIKNILDLVYLNIMSPKHKPLVWLGGSRKRLKEFPTDVQDVVGYALRYAQAGGKCNNSKPLKGFSGAGVLEVVEDHDGDTYRAVYTVSFSKVVYALHAFMKKSKCGVATPKHDMDMITSRYSLAKQRHTDWVEGRRSEP